MTRLRFMLIWISTCFLAAVFILAGAIKFGDPTAAEHFRKWGYGDWFRILVGIVELVGGVALLVPRAATAAGAILSVIMMGAIFTLFRAEEGKQVLAPALILWMLIYVAYTRLPQSPWGKRQG